MTKKSLIHFAKNYDQANQLKFEEQGINASKPPKPRRTEAVPFFANEISGVE